MLVLAAAVSILLTGCLQGEVDVTVNSDRSGQVSVEVFPNSDIRAALAGTDVEALIDGQFEQIEGVQFEEFKRGEREGYRLVVPFDDYREFTDTLTAGGTVAGRQVTLFSQFSLTELAEGGWSLDAKVNPVGQMLAADGDFQMPQTLEEVMDAVGVGAAGTGLDLTIALPGKVVSSNAARVDGGSATWHMDDPDAPAELTMRTEPKTLVSPAVMIVGAGAAVVLAGMVLSLFAGGRKYKKTEGDRRRSRQRRQRKAKQRVEAPRVWAQPTAPHGSTASQRPAGLPPLEPLPSSEQPPSSGPLPSSEQPPTPDPSVAPTPAGHEDGRD